MTMKPEKGRVRVFRFDPASDPEPRYQTYAVPYQGATVLQVLQHIYEELDPSLAFRFGCDGSGPARCGACAVEVNGNSALACREPASAEMTVNPHPKFRIIRDLVVDLETEKA